ncbi:MAG: F0F1 ATP synthase subunit delta [Alphaproteobacteria bacterium]
MTSEDTHVSGVAGRYAIALFELAREQNELEATEAALIQLDGLLKESETLRRFVLSPLFSAHNQSQVVTLISEKVDLGDLAQNFLQLLVKNRRLSALSEIIANFRKLTVGSRDELTAEVVSAIPLGDAHAQQLKAELSAKTGKHITLNSKVDPSILGGLVVKIGSRMIDSSIRTKLNNLKIAMKEVG